ncbi:hypothetical protein [Oxynema sp. CENA135]|uniref:hypothetical protein n=1 Tax=Oxynema sp. CENA135 TaxID=984206 RepID=UPI001F4052CD|nr:hypothetical protein [Oxynema sp. CENA135]
MSDQKDIIKSLEKLGKLGILTDIAILENQSHYLQEIKRIYEQIGQVDLWQELIQNLRSKYRRFSALNDELNKANL